MPAGAVSVTTTWTLIKTTTKDTLVRVGSKPITICVGDTTGVTVGTGVPCDANQSLVIPSGVSVYGIVASGDAPVWWTDFAA